MITEERLGAGLREFTARLADVVSVTGEGAHIPSCPEWSLRQLATHVGRAHRWAGEIVNRRATEMVSFREAPDGKLPGDPAARPGWLTAGADGLIAAVGDAGAEPVWTFSGLAPARFWLRRMAHETAVHCADAELAVGRPVPIPADLAVDGISEWYDIAGGELGGRSAPLAEGATLHVHATDDGLDGGGEWLLTGTASGVAVQPDHAAAGHGSGKESVAVGRGSGKESVAVGRGSGKESRADAAVRGPAATLFLVLMRRLPPDTPGIEVHGDGAVLSHWLANTAF